MPVVSFISSTIGMTGNCVYKHVCGVSFPIIRAFWTVRGFVNTTPIQPTVGSKAEGGSCPHRFPFFGHENDPSSHHLLYVILFWFNLFFIKHFVCKDCALIPLRA